jgi:metal-responsive CopG/Arc/MetJ family transcriptional regulator
MDNKKEKITELLNIRIQPTLMEKFKKKCNKNYKTFSEVIRELIIRYIEKS